MREFTKKIADQDYIKSAYVVLNPNDNGGQSIALECDFFHNGEPDGVYARINLQLYCYDSHSTDIHLGNIGIQDLEKALSQMKKVQDSVQKLGTSY